MALTRPTIYNLNTNVEVFNDSLTVLNAGATSPNTDVGFIFNRAQGLVPNVAVYWSESVQSIMYALTANSGVTNSNVVVSSYANITVGNLLSINGNIFLNGATGTPGQYITSTASGTAWTSASYIGGPVSVNVYPTSNLTISSGGASNYWANVYTGNLIINNGIYYANGTVFSSGSGSGSTYGNTQMLANLATATSNIAIGGNLSLTTQLTTTTYTANTGTLNVGGNINYGPDYGLIASFVANVPNYAYVAIQNLNAGGNASASFTAYNNTGTSYLELGVNSSNFNAAASGYVNNSLNQPSAAYAYAYAGDMVVGTWNNNGLHFITNAVTTPGDSMYIAGNGNVYISGNLTVSGNTNFTYTTTNFVSQSANVVQTAYLQGNAATNNSLITLVNNLAPNANLAINLGAPTTYFGTIWSGQVTANTVSATTFSGSGASLTNIPGAQVTGTVTTATNALNVQINNPTTATLYPAMSTTSTNGANSAIWTSSAFTWNGLTGVVYSQAFQSLTTTITSSAPSTSATSGALQVTGGVGIGGNVYVGGNILVSNSGILWSANGQPYSSGGGGGSYTGGVVTSNVYPSGNLTTNLGGTSNFWGNTYTGNLTVSANLIQPATAPAISTNTLNINLAAGPVANVLVNSAISTINFVNPLPSGSVSSFMVIFNYNGTGYSVTWPASVRWPNAVAPTLTNTNGKRDMFSFLTIDGGTTYNATIAAQNI